MKLGVVGGSGLYEMKAVKDIRPIHIDTPFGPPSDAYYHGKLGNTDVFFLSRHGRGHRKLPSEINHRANILGFKLLGVERVVGFSAVGSLKETIRPRDIVLPDQYYDRAKIAREHTFFGNGIVAHIPFGEPVCAELRGILYSITSALVAGKKAYAGLQIHHGGTYVNMEGPAFSTKAESGVYRQLGFDIIGMTSLPEAKLCREAEICYAPLSMVTDYDCWHETVEAVNIEMILENLKANVTLAHDILANLVKAIQSAKKCSCGSALRSAIVTAPDAIPESAKAAIEPIIRKYVKCAHPMACSKRGRILSKLPRLKEATRDTEEERKKRAGRQG
jgi:5'-methylthioadenosine phosphorylase